MPEYRKYGRTSRVKEVKFRRLDIVRVKLDHDSGEFAIEHEMLETEKGRKPQFTEVFVLVSENRTNREVFGRAGYELFHGIKKSAFKRLPKYVALEVYNGFLLPRVAEAAFGSGDSLALSLLLWSYLSVRIPPELRRQHEDGKEIGYDKTAVMTDVWQAWVDWKSGVAAGRLKTDLGHFVRNRLKENWKKLYASVAPQYPEWIKNPCGDLENFANTPMIGPRTDPHSGLVILPGYHGEIASFVPGGDERSETNETGEGDADEGCALGAEAIPGHNDEDLGDVRHGGRGGGSVDALYNEGRPQDEAYEEWQRSGLNVSLHEFRTREWWRLEKRREVEDLRKRIFGKIDREHEIRSRCNREVLVPTLNNQPKIVHVALPTRVSPARLTRSPLRIDVDTLSVADTRLYGDSRIVNGLGPRYRNAAGYEKAVWPPTHRDEKGKNPSPDVVENKPEPPRPLIGMDGGGTDAPAPEITDSLAGQSRDGQRPLISHRKPKNR